MRRYGFPIIVVVAAVLVALALGGFFKPSGVQDVVLVPVTKEKDGYRVTVEQIFAKRHGDGRTARLDLLLTVERLDGKPIEHDPYLAAEAWILKKPYCPQDVIEVPPGGLDVPEMQYAVPPLGNRNAARRILSFHSVPETWMAVDLNLLVAASQPEADFVLGGIDLSGPKSRLPRAPRGRTEVEVLSVARLLPDFRPPEQPTTLVRVREKSGLIAPAKGWSSIGLPLGRGRLIDEDGKDIGRMVWRDPKGSLTRGEYIFSVSSDCQRRRQAALEFTSTEAMLKRAIGFRFEGMTTLSPG